MSDISDIVPEPRQQVALSCPAFELMYGGQKGGGKTFFLCVAWAPLLNRAFERWVATGREQRHCRIPIFRKNLDDLTDIINKSHEVYPLIDPSATFNKNSKTWTFCSGATVEFHHLDGPEDHKGWNGQELMGLGFDQVEEIPEDVYTFLVIQVRTKDEHYKDLLAVRSTANPGGRYGSWVKKRFVDPCPAGNKIIEVEVTNRDGTKKRVTRAFIPAALQDNKYLNADGVYEANLRASGLPEHLLKAYLEGDWDAVKGAFFSSLIRPEKHFRLSFPISGQWDVKFGQDWGSTAPAAVLWGAKDPTCDRIYIIDELHQPGVTGRLFGEKMAAKVARQQWSAEHKWAVDEFYGLIDSQAMGKYGSEGATAAAGIASNGFRIFPANKDRYAGIEQMCERLQIRADGLPGVVIFKDRCPILSRAIQVIAVDPKDQKNYDPDSDESHIMDAFRFLLMDWPVFLGKKADPIDEEVARWERIIRKTSIKADRDDAVTTGYE